MNSTTTPRRRPVRRRFPALIAAGALAAGVSAVAPSAANGATFNFPSNQAFDGAAAPWKSAATCSHLDGLITPGATQGQLQNLLQDLRLVFPDDGGLSSLLNGILNGLDVTVDDVGTLLSDLGVLCSIDNSHTSGDGNPPGALRTELKGLIPDAANIVELLGTGLATWTSEDFRYDEGAPTNIEFSFDGKAQLTGLVQEGKGFNVRARLTTVNTGQVRDIGVWTFTTADGAFRTRSVQLPASALQPGNFYRLSLEIETTGDIQLLSTSHVMLIDNVRLTATAPAGAGGPGGPGGPGGEGSNLRSGEGAGGLGACTTNIREPRQPGPRNAPDRIRLTREQLVINQRISSAGVRRVNSVMDRLMGGLTSDDVQNCTLGPNEFSPALLQAIANGAPAGPATPAGAARPTPNRTAGQDESNQIVLSRAQLLINQRISSAAVRRVNAITERLRSGLTAGDFRLGGLQAVTLNSAGRARFANALPAVQEAPAAFVPFNTAPKGPGNPQDVKVSREQLVINQRISAAAVRRINAIQAQFDVGLTGAHVKDGTLLRNNLAPAIQLGRK